MDERDMIKNMITYIIYFFQTGKVNADAFQRSFLQYVYCTFEENKLLGKEPFVCPACSPEMVAVSVDGNRKLYRFQKTNQASFFDGVFLAQDSEVSTLVGGCSRGCQKLQEKQCVGNLTGQQQGRPLSEPASWMKKVLKLLCVGMDFFSKVALNMYRGEIFAYPMFLQKEFQSSSFLAMDVTCRYAPYLDKVSEALPHLQPLKEMRHCLSVMHAKPTIPNARFASTVDYLILRFFGMHGTRRVPAPLLVKKWNKLTVLIQMCPNN
ncbi:hypothetical protein F7725_020138 [Dissostichus mawsoni]|uniref:Uncharacterized protein n=1 Tax=Dissostichus mawsoni TaxID=36200 RepID=A0A7J5YCF5_DISMA|nr:hypothetical protein F7725_020138 [Dissostichus mawsoni]